MEAAGTIWALLEGSRLAKDVNGETTIDEDDGELRQDRYPLRTAPQFLGPQIEDVLSAFTAVTLECNSSESSLKSIHIGVNISAL